MHLLLFLSCASFFYVKVYSEDSRKSIHPKVVGGTNATSIEFPSFAILMTEYNEFLCGGTIINAQWVLTAAHCLDLTNEIVVLAGTNKLYEEISSGPSKIYRTEAYFKHPQFFFTPEHPLANNDIGLVKVSDRFNFSQRVAPILLPNECEEKGYIQGTVIGFGTNLNQEFPKVLQKATMNIYHSFDAYNCIVNSFFHFDLNAMLCAGASRDGTGACFGDSGGPLIVQRSDGQQVVVGLISGNGFPLEEYACAAKNNPTRFTRVSSFLDWINEIIASN